MDRMTRIMIWRGITIFTRRCSGCAIRKAYPDLLKRTDKPIGLRLKTIEIFGRPDDRKLKSSMTLFSLLPDADPVFQKMLDKYFNGEKDSRTLKVLGLL